jgi:hypothetical protein
MRPSLAALVALVLSLCATAEASAATRFVEKTGSDSSDCTNAGAPCATVGYAVGQAGEGDTIQIGAGTFAGAVTTEKVLSFVGAGAGSLPGGGAVTTIQGPAGEFAQSGKFALDLRSGGSVRALRASGGTGGTGTQYGAPGGDGIIYDSNTSAATSLNLQDVVAVGGSGGPGSVLIGPGGRGLRMSDGPGPVALTSTGSDFGGGAGLTAGTALQIYGDTATATVTDARVANDETHGTGVAVGSDAHVVLDSVDVRSGEGEAAGIYNGVLTIRRSRLHSGGWALFVYPSSEESPELEVFDSLVVSDNSQALFLESESDSPAVARIFGSTVIGHGEAAVLSGHEAGEEAATVVLRNSVIRHFPPAEVVPRTDLLANGGTIDAANSSFDTRREENGGVATAPGSGSNVAGDPGLLDPTGGVYVLQNTSPLIDRGDPSLVQAGEQDLLGTPRALDGNRDCTAVPDIGAFEVTGQEATCPVDPAPSVSAFGITNKVFAPAGKSAKATTSARKPKQGTRFTYKLSEPARVAIVIARKTLGRRLGKGTKSRCTKVTPANRDKGKPCTRFVKKTTIGGQEQSGRQSTPWNGRIGKKPAKPGKYRATIVATDTAGQRSKPRSLSFKIVAG